MHPVSLFVADIDGCLAVAYQPYDLPGFHALAQEAQAAGAVGHHPSKPALSLCSGRPYPYVEAVTQALGLQLPVLFEGGGGGFDPVRAKRFLHPGFTDEVAAEVAEVRRWLEVDILPGSGLSLDIGKLTQAGGIGPAFADVQRLLPQVEAFIEAQHPNMWVAHTEVSIDIIPRHLTKREGLQWLAELLDVPLAEMAYIGDAVGDLGALAIVGHSFAPANAIEAVRQQVATVTQAPVLDGVREAYEACVRLNQGL